jgi:DNA replication protein DnaC
LQQRGLYKCSQCRDTGWILIEQKDSAPLAISCQCRERDKIKNQWKAAGINPENSTLTFANFEIWNEHSRKINDTATAYFESYESIKRNRENSIMFCGQVGSGKTHICLALAFNFLKENIKVVYMPYRNVITNIKLNMRDVEYYKKTISKFQICDILLIDDLFKGKINESDINIMHEILNYRYDNHLPIIVSTEFTAEMLLSFDEGLGSKICHMCEFFTVEIEKDRRNNYRLR